jgi:hypothetical protein
MDARQILISDDPQVNWDNDAIQFPRLIAEMEAAGFFALPTEDEHTVASEVNPIVEAVCDSMDITYAQLVELIDRAQESWDIIKARTARRMNLR